MISPMFLFVFAVISVAVVIVGAILRAFKGSGQTRIGLTILGALIGPVAGFFGMFFLQSSLPHHGCGVTGIAEAILSSLFIGAPLGLITFALIGHWLGSLLEPKPKGDNVAASDEELKTLAERGGSVKVRVAFTSYVNHDAIRGDLEKAGFLEIDQRAFLERVFSSGSVKCVTGTIDVSRIGELAALSFVESVKEKVPMDGRRG